MDYILVKKIKYTRTLFTHKRSKTRVLYHKLYIRILYGITNTANREDIRKKQEPGHTISENNSHTDKEKYSRYPSMTQRNTY